MVASKDFNNWYVASYIRCFYKWLVDYIIDTGDDVYSAYEKNNSLKTLEFIHDVFDETKNEWINEDELTLSKGYKPDLVYICIQIMEGLKYED